MSKDVCPLTWTAVPQLWICKDVCPAVLMTVPLFTVPLICLISVSHNKSWNSHQKHWEERCREAELLCLPVCLLPACPDRYCVGVQARLKTSLLFSCVPQ